MSELLERVKQRKFFYRDYYRRACGALSLALCVIAILSVLIVYFYIQRPSPDFYATSYDGKLIKLTPLDAPNYSKLPLIK